MNGWASFLSSMISRPRYYLITYIFSYIYMSQPFKFSGDILINIWMISKHWWCFKHWRFCFSLQVCRSYICIRLRKRISVWIWAYLLAKMGSIFTLRVIAWMLKQGNANPVERWHGSCSRWIMIYVIHCRCSKYPLTHYRWANNAFIKIPLDNCFTQLSWYFEDCHMKYIFQTGTTCQLVVAFLSLQKEGVQRKRQTSLSLRWMPLRWTRFFWCFSMAVVLQKLSNGFIWFGYTILWLGFYIRAILNHWHKLQ